MEVKKILHLIMDSQQSKIDNESETESMDSQQRDELIALEVCKLSHYNII